MNSFKKLAFALVSAVLVFFPALGLGVSEASGAPADVPEASPLQSAPKVTFPAQVPTDDEVIEFSDEEVPFVGGQEDVESASPFIRDHSEIFTSSKLPDWEEQLSALADQYGIAPYVVTVDSFQYLSPEQWGANYYNANQLGLGVDSADGVIMIINPVTRDLWFLGHGEGENALTPYGIDKLYERVKNPLGDDDWDSGLDVYIAEITDYLVQWEAGTPYDQGHPVPNRITSESTGAGVLLAVILGAVTGHLAMKRLKDKHDTAQVQSGAACYIVSGSGQITGARDNFVNTYTTQVVRPKESKSDSSSGHTLSSGGTSFSSGGGKF